MNEKLVKEILKDAICEDGKLHDMGWYLNWCPGMETATLDGEFTADDLEAIACWMRREVVA